MPRGGLYGLGEPSLFEQKLRYAAPLMYRSLLDLGKIMRRPLRIAESAGLSCGTMPRKSEQALLDELIKAELAELRKCIDG